MGVKVVQLSQLAAHIDLPLGQAQGGIVGRVPLHIGIKHLGGLFLNGDVHRGRLGDVAGAVHRHIGEVVLALLALVGGVPEGGGVPLIHGDLPPGGAVHDLEGDRIAVGIHGGKAAGDGHVSVGGKGQVLRDGGGVVGIILGGDGDGNGGHRQGQRPGQQHR